MSAPDLISAAETSEHVRDLLGAGWTATAIARAANVTGDAVLRLTQAGAGEKRMSARVASRILAIDGSPQQWWGRVPDLKDSDEGFLEDVGFLADQGETMPGAARRMGLTLESFYQRLYRLGQRELMARLQGPDSRFQRAPLVPAGPARAHLVKLRGSGWTVSGIALAAGVSSTAIWEHVAGKYAQIRADVADRLLAIDGSPTQEPIDFVAEIKACDGREIALRRKWVTDGQQAHQAG